MATLLAKIKWPVAACAAVLLLAGVAAIAQQEHWMPQVGSSRGSVFYRCEHADVDARFPKYPRLPVLTCAAYVPASSDPQH